MEYNFREIEKKWQKHWKETGAYKVSNESDKPKFYVLDMFPYPSGAGLHVGHPLGYIASDIYARYKRLKGYNVLHPMGFDSFGLPAEQYAIETGQHPAVTTEKNIERYHEQLDNIGFCYDWSREVRTSDPEYYKWTQYIFLQLFDSWYNRKNNRTERIATLIETFQSEGNQSELRNSKAEIFTAEQWLSFDEAKKQEILMDYRIAFSAFGEVNWCEALGTVLANDEVVNGVSERGGHPVVKKKMRQWYLRITEYADRLLQGLEVVDFSESMKEMQRNWIGRSSGASITFRLAAGKDLTPNPSPKERGTVESGSKEKGLRQDSEEVLSGEPRYMTNTFEQWKRVTEFAKQNRKNSTEAEDILWQHLRNRKLDGFKFRRQHAVAGYIPDFVCLEKKLIVEVDGGYHDDEEQVKFDELRSKWLQEHDYKIVRVANDEVLNNLQAVLQNLSKALSQNQERANETNTPSSSQSSSLTSPSPSERGSGGEVIVYTTRPDTIFGVDFMVLAPEHEIVNRITTPQQKPEIDKYLTYVKSRSERERMSEVKQITGAFTGAYCINPFDGKEIPVWISEYVLAGYGTGAIMAVPCGDQRDFNFAKHFNIPITNIIGDAFNGEEANPTKDAVLQNSGFLNGMVMRDAIDEVIDELEEMGIGKRQVNYRMRDAGFSRQRYWGEPFPIVYKDGIAYPLDESELPIELPKVDTYSPGPEGEGPLANITDWVDLTQTLSKGEGFANASPRKSSHLFPPSPLERGPGGEVRRETNTMPGYAGSSWYFLRYMDPHNDKELIDKKVADYWGQVDLYIGGTEHAVGHLLYSRMWTKALFDLGYISFDEPFKKLVNQGMIQGSSRFVYRVRLGKGDELKRTWSEPVFVSYNFIRAYEIHELNNIEFARLLAGSQHFADYINDRGFDFINITALHVDVNIVDGNVLDVQQFKKLKPEYSDADFINYKTLDDIDKTESEGIYLCGAEVEKMSKSKYNVVNPDDIVDRFGADTFRMYEMFLGPVEQSKPWDTKGIEGVHRFLRKFWRLFIDEVKGLIVTDDEPTPAELKVLHKTIKKIEDDTERFSFNTTVSTFMIAVNELGDLKCHKKKILEPLLILLTPYAPHISEELYQQLLKASPAGRLEGVSILDASFPNFEEKYLTETTKEYPISINGKVRANMNIALDAPQPEVEQMVLASEVVQKWLEGKQPKKIIYVRGKMINVVV